MKVPSNPIFTVRSTVVIVVLLVSTFILFDSYNWHLLSVGWTQPDSETLSHATSKLTPESTASRTEALNHVTPDFLSGDDDYADDKNPADRRPQSPRKENISGQPSRRKEDKHSTDGQSSAANHDANLTPSKNPAVHEPGLILQNSGAAPTLGIDTSPVDSKTGEDRDQAQFSNTGSYPINIAAPPLTNDRDSTERAVAPGDHRGQNRNLTVRTDRGSEAAATSTADNVMPYSTPAADTKVAEPVLKKPTRRYDELSSLQKVELDLWQARAAMRKVVLAQMNSANAAFGDEFVTNGEPSGDVYRNAAIFRQSYQEMERIFKVYAYQEGEEPLVHTGPCKEIYAVEGRFIQELQGDNPFVTSDPEAAHVFFLPFSVAMMVTYLYTAHSGDMSPLLRFVKDYVDVVSRKYPYWTRSEGADHFMLSCHDWGPHVSRADDNLVSKTIRVLCNANVSEGYIPTKDASLPEINLVGGEIPAPLGGLPPSKRTILAFFAGADHGPVRPALFKSWEGKEGNIYVYHQVPVEGQSYHEYMKNSKYCLCPGGYEVNSPRIVEAIYNDCVPVVIADKFVLPFSDVLDWKTFAVHVLEKDIPNLKTILEAIPMETYIQMQTKVKQVQHHFLVNQPPKRYDAFHMILHSVWLRRLNIKILG